MSLLLNSTPISSSSSPFLSHHSKPKQSSSSLALSSGAKVNKSNGFCGRAFIFDPTQERILKEAVKEPVAFLGGVFAGLLRLDLNEDPLKEWVTKTVEAAGITQELDSDDVLQKETPLEIEIE